MSSISNPAVSIASTILILVKTAHSISIDEAILTDLIPTADIDASGSTCADPGAASSSNLTFPGTEPNTWDPAFEQYESGLFLAQLQHVDPNDADRSWNMRIGKNGIMYSFHSPNTYGEAIPPQVHEDAPWIDEVHQLVAVDSAKNNAWKNSTQNLTSNDAPYYIHQAGIYQFDSPYTDDVFFSPAVASHCTSSSCTVASWGQQAWVPTNYTSNVLYVSKFQNCGDGVVRHTQVVQNFSPLGSNIEELTYLNTPWSGVRPSNLGDVLEADPITSNLEISSSNGDPRLDIYPWGTNNEVAIKETKDTAGYTIFANGIWPNATATPLVLPCKEPGGDCYNDAFPDTAENCMVTSCTDDQVNNEGYQRMGLRVPPSGTNCNRHGTSTADDLVLRCTMVDNTGYGKLYGTPEGDYMFSNSTGGFIRFTKIRNWVWSPTNQNIFFHTGLPDDGTWENPGGLKDQIEATFPNNEPIVASNYIAPMPSNYDPTSLSSLTFVYGKGDEYQPGGLVEGSVGRRRLGSTSQPGRDYTVFTINHIASGGVGGVEPGGTYHSTQYLVNGKLGDAETNAGSLVDQTFMDKIEEHQFTGRAIQIYVNDRDEPGAFGASASDVAGGNTTTCGQGSVTCTGSSTPGTGLRAFFLVQCGANTYFGPDQYYFMPGRNHTEDASLHQGTLRSYACEGQPSNVRPTWKLMGYFPENTGCASVETRSYDETFCDRSASPTVSQAPSSSPTVSPTVSQAPSSSPTDEPVPMVLPCIKPGGDCTNTANPNDADNCMVASCTDADVDAGYIRMELVVPTTGTACKRHSYSSNPGANGKLVVGCQMHSGVYGRRWPEPAGSYKFLNSTWDAFPFSSIYHWSFDPPNKRTYFITNYDDTPENEVTVQELMNQLFPPGEPIRAVFGEALIEGANTEEKTTQFYECARHERYRCGGRVKPIRVKRFKGKKSEKKCERLCEKRTGCIAYEFHSRRVRQSGNLVRKNTCKLFGGPIAPVRGRRNRFSTCMIARSSCIAAPED